MLKMVTPQEGEVRMPKGKTPLHETEVALIRSWVEQAGYAGAVTTNYGKTKQDPYALHRIKIGESSGNLFNFWAKVSGYYQCGKKRVQAR